MMPYDPKTILILQVGRGILPALVPGIFGNFLLKKPRRFPKRLYGFATVFIKFSSGHSYIELS